MTKLLHGFRSLRNRNYRLFWSGQLVSLAGTWMADVALSWLVLTRYNSSVALGTTMAIRFLPSLLFSLYGGVLADRFRKRRAMIVCESFQMVVALALAILISTDLITLIIIYVLAFARGMIDAIEGPTRQAFVPEMVGTEDLSNAIALNSTQFNAARIVGPAIGAAVISAVGIAACFYLNAASFLAVIIALLAIRVSELHLVPRAPREAALGQLRAGLRYARSTPHVVVVLIVMGAIGAFGYNFTTLAPLVTKEVLGAGVNTLALLTTSMGIGAVVAGLFVAYRGRPTQRLLLVSASVFVVMLAAVGLSAWIPLTTVLMFGLGVVGVLFMTTANTRLQLAVPGHMRGRVMGIYALLFVGTTPIGAYVMGQLADLVGVTVMVLIMAALCAVGVVAGIVYIRRSGTVDFLLVGDVPGDGTAAEEGLAPQ
jgi:predicted MFS family arabinose efflux permease